MGSLNKKLNAVPEKPPKYISLLNRVCALSSDIVTLRLPLLSVSEPQLIVTTPFSTASVEYHFVLSGSKRVNA